MRERRALVDRAQDVPAAPSAGTPATLVVAGTGGESLEALALARGRHLLALGITTFTSLRDDPPTPGKRGSERRDRLGRFA